MGRLSSGRRFLSLLLALVLLAGCAARDSSADQDRHNGFYGAATAGGAVMR
jgi:hypothetical protein